jgi:hypothetical protein
MYSTGMLQYLQEETSPRPNYSYMITLQPRLHITRRLSIVALPKPTINHLFNQDFLVALSGRKLLG